MNDYPQLMQKPITDVHQLDMIELRNDRLSKVSASTVGRDLGVLGGVFKYARQELRILKTSPLIDVAKPTQAPHRERRITQEEINTILLGFNYDATYQPITKRQQVAWAFLFALETAMRASEITNMQWCNVYEDHVLLPDTKNGTARKVPLSRHAIQLLELMKGLDKDKVLTISDRSNALSHDFWLVVSNRLGITDLNFHDTRHEATTRLAKKLPVQDLAKVTGHKDLKMLMRYYNPTAQELAQRLNELDDPNIIPFKQKVI
ncbi:site-specific integrase [Acinetobacter radioresistens]|uniref:site-specific integrase n=1 Tax=Acinetobacter radioresistens TaxID=40216 RepID=UPI001D18E540|nr:site-specific integrase [Acinetobacter radioresistens]